VFLGVEGASVYSRHAERREDVGRATVLGFLSVFAVFASVTIVSYGILPASELADLRQPSMAGVLEEAVGGWGKTFVSVGLIVSVLGAYLAWTLINAEVLYAPATTAVMPKFLARNNKNHTPIAALITTNLAVQALLAQISPRGQHRLRPWHPALHLGPTGTGPAGVSACGGDDVRRACRRRGCRNSPHLHWLPDALIPPDAAGSLNGRSAGPCHACCKADCAGGHH